MDTEPRKAPATPRKVTGKAGSPSQRHRSPATGKGTTAVLSPPLPPPPPVFQETPHYDLLVDASGDPKALAHADDEEGAALRQQITDALRWVTDPNPATLL